MNEQTAKELVVRAGHALVESGLIARTWGNVSCRTENGRFAVTPSGRSYETLRADDVVLCSVEDCSYDGNIKPSSEKRIHALLYRTYPEANFIIHTHQNWASCVGASGITDMLSIDAPLLGGSVPIASYGLPGTKKLMNGVGSALARCGGHAIILSHHGAVCFGRNYEEAFAAARQLEEACLAFVLEKARDAACHNPNSNTAFAEQDMRDYYEYLERKAGFTAPQPPVYFGNSRRTSDGFILNADGETHYRFADIIASGTALNQSTARIHKAVYESRTDINFINQSVDVWLLAASRTGRPLRPWLDDFAQIVGCSVRCAAGSEPQQIVKALRGRNGVLVPDAGALCCAAAEDDIRAVELVMIKNAMAQIGTRFIGGARAIGLPDCLLMNFVYHQSYSKKANS